MLNDMGFILSLRINFSKGLMKLLKFNPIVAVALTMLLTACGGDKATSEQEEGKPSEISTTLVETESEDEDVYEFIPPSPIQIASMFNNANLDYNAELPCTNAMVTEFSSKFEKSLAFGIYSSDLAYSVMNEKYNEASDHLKTLKQLSQDIGLETVFNSGDIIERFENNIGNQDSIIDILIYVQENTDDYIEENGKDDLSVIYYTGAWIEGMYFGAKTVANDPDKLIGITISQQMTFAKILHKGLSHMHEQSDDIEDLKESIQEVIDTFNQMETVINLGEDIEYIDVVLTEEELSTMSGKIIELRESIIH